LNRRISGGLLRATSASKYIFRSNRHGDTATATAMPRISKEKLNPGVEKLTAKFKKDGLALFREELPKRIEQLTVQLETEDFKQIKIDDFEMATDVVEKLNKILAAGGDQMNRNRKRKAAEVAGSAQKPAVQALKDIDTLQEHTVRPIHSNARIVRMMRTLKEQYAEALEIASTLKMWIQLNVPRIEDGNNFGVDVQTECITELSGLEDKCCGILETTTKYFSGRAKLLSKCIKYPEIEDYRRSIEEVDHSK